MNPELADRFKDFHKVQSQVDVLSRELAEIKSDVEEMILQSKLVGKKFSVGDRIITYKKTETTAPLSQKYIAECLEDYYRDDPSEAEAIMTYFLENRPKKSRYGLEIRKKPTPKNK